MNDLDTILGVLNAWYRKYRPVGLPRFYGEYKAGLPITHGPPVRDPGVAVGAALLV